MKYEIYKRYSFFRSQWRWRLLAANGNIIATSGESYHNLADMLKAVRSVKESAEAPIVNVNGE